MLRFYPIVQWIAFALVQGTVTSIAILPGTKRQCFVFVVQFVPQGLVGWVIYAARKATQSFADEITSAVNRSGVGFPKHRRKQRFWPMFAKIAWDIGKTVVVETV
ncbi:hypothetical protein GPALN_004907 [Globodera pallida]|nr:hypothetical protein GPALN_004907 [Globodera pallida]